MSGRPTIRDVGRAAGVSRQTVSRVLNASEAVHPATRARVVAAIESLGYVRDEAAAQLARRR
ncbi:LacI family DNA-binding transcriptional regulator [Microbacterium sp. JZ31]|uniref:LacI family DNA-binding transcriptional regulator n=1 Tax=Microbacterium sp. JZ31 TaxID=1906274 RepID=UPI001931207F|nr:LacI family DNA-binding transcriptional regulator [Microbacterium sp. JZ31]